MWSYKAITFTLLLQLRQCEMTALRILDQVLSCISNQLVPFVCFDNLTLLHFNKGRWTTSFFLLLLASWGIIFIDLDNSAAWTLLQVWFDQTLALFRNISGPLRGRVQISRICIRCWSGIRSLWWSLIYLWLQTSQHLELYFVVHLCIEDPMYFVLVFHRQRHWVLIRCRIQWLPLNNQ